MSHFHFLSFSFIFLSHVTCYYYVHNTFLFTKKTKIIMTLKYVNPTELASPYKLHPYGLKCHFQSWVYQYISRKMITCHYFSHNIAETQFTLAKIFFLILLLKLLSSKTYYLIAFAFVDLNIISSSVWRFTVLESTNEIKTYSKKIIKKLTWH